MADDNRKKVSKVIEGEIVEKKKGFIDDLELEDNREVARFALTDVLIPKFKEIVYELISGSLEKKLYGTSSGGRRGGSNGQRSNYNSYYQSSAKRGDRTGDSGERLNRDYKDIIFKTRSDAEKVLDTLEDLIEQYEFATIGDLLDAAGYTQDDNFTKNSQYGWTNLSSATVRRVREGYILDMPRARFVN